MNFEQVIEQMDADLYQRLKLAVELGKWPNGERLTAEQREISLQAVIAYEHKNLPPDQRTGYIDTADKTACGHDNDVQEAPLRWK